MLHAAGGAIAVTADDRDESDTGVNIMIAGLAFQVASLFLFVVLCTEYGLRVRKNQKCLNQNFNMVYNTRMWKLFLVGKSRAAPVCITNPSRTDHRFLAGLLVATLTIFTRCVFRIAELQQAFNGELFNDETAFMILEGPMIIIASLCLFIFHPGLTFKGR